MFDLGASGYEVRAKGSGIQVGNLQLLTRTVCNACIEAAADVTQPPSKTDKASIVQVSKDVTSDPSNGCISES